MCDLCTNNVIKHDEYSWLHLFNTGTKGYVQKLHHNAKRINRKQNEYLKCMNK